MMGGVEVDAWGYLKVNNFLKKRRKKDPFHYFCKIRLSRKIPKPY